jgi:hypothetical protein
VPSKTIVERLVIHEPPFAPLYPTICRCRQKTDSDAHNKPITPRLRDDNFICCFKHGRMSQKILAPSHSLSCRRGQHEPAFSVNPRRLGDCTYPGRPSNGS